VIFLRISPMCFCNVFWFAVAPKSTPKEIISFFLTRTLLRSVRVEINESFRLYFFSSVQRSPKSLISASDKHRCNDLGEAWALISFQMCFCHVFWFAVAPKKARQKRLSVSFKHGLYFVLSVLK
jgi:hypothetical protein